MANNANAQAFPDNLSAISTLTNELRQALVAMQQQLATLAQAVQPPNQPPLPSFHPPPVQPAAYNAANAAAPAPGIYVPPPMQPPAPWNSTWRGGGRAECGGRGRYGRGGGGRGRGRGSVAYQFQPPANNQGGGGMPSPQQPAGGERWGRAPMSQLNYYKKFNNWNVCFSCGFDVPNWHTSATCPAECRKFGHQEGYD